MGCCVNEGLIVFFSTYAPLLFKGALTTIYLWVVSSAVSLVVGLLCGIALSARMYRFPFGFLIWIYGFLVRSIPFYVQLLIAYFVIPQVLGINPSAWTVSIIALGLCSAGYVAEVMRSGINAVPAGQWEACFVLGYSRFETLRRIIIPQALRTIWPALISEYEKLIKTTSLVSTIGVFDLTRTGMNIVARELNPVPVYCCVALLYVGISSALNGGARLIERRMRS